jgi:hypothetical protein
MAANNFVAAQLPATHCAATCKHSHLTAPLPLTASVNSAGAAAATHCQPHASQAAQRRTNRKTQATAAKCLNCPAAWLHPSSARLAGMPNINHQGSSLHTKHTQRRCVPSSSSIPPPTQLCLLDSTRHTTTCCQNDRQPNTTQPIQQSCTTACTAAVAVNGSRATLNRPQAILRPVKHTNLRQ